LHEYPVGVSGRCGERDAVAFDEVVVRIVAVYRRGDQDAVVAGNESIVLLLMTAPLVWSASMPV
jgi:hypothetical protein